MKIFVTGSEGYIGAILVPDLLKAGHEVTGLDTGYYRDGRLFSRNRNSPEVCHTLLRDLRNIEVRDLEGFDAVVHMAELSNDPIGENNPEVTFEINHLGSVRLAEIAQQAGVERFVYTSSCAVYGISDEVFVDETSATNPQTTYAECKILVEQDIGAKTSDSFCPVFLRNATAYGASPRMRFDIVVNNLTGLAWTTREISLTSDGSPWRPLVHIKDICSAIESALTAPASTVAGQVFNVGGTNENYKIRSVAEIVSEVVPGCEISFGAPSADNRSYRVNFDKIHEQLPGFKCVWSVQDGAEEMREVFEQIQMDAGTFGFRAFTRLEQLKYLAKTGQIDSRFRWNY